MAQTETVPPVLSSSTALPAPAYDTATRDDNLPNGTAQLDTNLPAYQPPAVTRSAGASTATRREAEHIYQSKNSKDRAWLTMKVKSRAPSAKSLPTFLEEDTITGEVALDLDKQDNIQAIIVKVKGQVVAPKSDIKTFLELSEVLWDTSRGDPRSPSSGKGKHNGKFNGQYSWSFSITLPKTTNVSPKQLKELGFPAHLPLPPSFSEKGCFSLLNYELSTVIKRSSLRVDTVLLTGFGYVPQTRPDQPSLLRQMAYREGAPLVGPDVDPEGWHVLPPVEVQGMMFSAVKASVKMTLALCKPLAYTRGSVIPCLLTLESSDTAALDLLANPKVPELNLYRPVHTNIGTPPVTTHALSVTDRSAKSPRPYSSATWWTGNTEELPASKSNKRVLNGEIRVPPSAKPSFTFGHFFVQYEIKLLPLKTTGFVPESQDALCTIDVQITSQFAPGPRPRVYSTATGNESAHPEEHSLDLLGLTWVTGDEHHGTFG